MHPNPSSWAFETLVFHDQLSADRCLRKVPGLQIVCSIILSIEQYTKRLLKGHTHFLSKLGFLWKVFLLFPMTSVTPKRHKVLRGKWVHSATSVGHPLSIWWVTSAWGFPEFKCGRMRRSVPSCPSHYVGSPGLLRMRWYHSRKIRISFFQW